MVQTSKTLKVTISGSYVSANRDIESFENVIGIIPRLDEDKANQMVIRRYAKIWVMQAKKPDGEKTYKAVQRVRQVFIDSIDDNDDAPSAQLSYVGKNVMEMNFEELQDFASANDLAGVPLYKTGGLTHARRVAFSEYAIKVLELEEYLPTDKDEKQNLYDYRVMGFNPNRFEPIIADDQIRRRGGEVANIEETIDREALSLQGKAKAPTQDVRKGSKLTMEQLKAIATQRNINFNKGISYDALYAKIYGAQKAA
jgi:hypothetical protein